MSEHDDAVEETAYDGTATTEPHEAGGEDSATTDAAIDEHIESLADGHDALGPREASGTLAFAVPAREQFDALDDPPVTGDARVDAASARLVELVDLPTSDHVAVYDDVHRRLQDALADADVR